MNPDIFRKMLDDVSDGVYFLDLDRNIVFWSRGAERLTGYPAEEVLGRSCAEDLLVHVDCDGRPLCGRETCPAAIAMRDRSSVKRQILLKHRNGHRVPVTTLVRPILKPDGSLAGAAEVFTVTDDTVATGARLRELEEMALLDPLTGVGNRRFGEKELRDILNETRRYRSKFAVLFLDIDRFKHVNDVHGHVVGDRILKMVAQTLSHNVRSFDAVIRWGGEEFLALLKNIDEKHLLSAAEKLLALVASASLTHESFQLRVTVSVGATLLQSEDSPETVVRRADEAMYESKRCGGNRVTKAPTKSGDAEVMQASCLETTRSS